MSDAKVVFIGSKMTGLAVLQAAMEACPGVVRHVITFNDNPTHEQRSTRWQFPKLGLPCTVTSSHPVIDEVLREVKPNLVLVCCWYKLFTPETLALVPKWVGVHFAPLPRYRGSSPLVWQLINGERETAVSLFEITAGMDDGPLYAQADTDIHPDEYIRDVDSRLRSLACLHVRSDLGDILNGSLKPAPQVGEPTYCHARTPLDGLINWAWTAERIYNFVRAQSRPWPGAWTKHVLTYHVWRASVGPTYYGNPGQVVKLDGKWGVICGDMRVLWLEETEPIIDRRIMLSSGLAVPHGDRRLSRRGLKR